MIAESFEHYGFVNIETPAVESTAVLTAKGGEAVSKQIFGLYGLAQGGDDLKKYSLHFDLTVPLARYVIDHEQEIKFPFKRYQIQKVWRGERQQKGRFKEFYQCDVDVIDDGLNTYYDAEVIEVLYQTVLHIFAKLDLDKKLEVRLNNRKIIDSLFAKYGLNQEDSAALLAILDDYYKYEKIEDYTKDVANLLGDKTDAFVADVDALKAYFAGSGNAPESVSEEALQEAQYILEVLSNNGVFVVYDPYIVRGLDYYDGTVFETYVQEHEEIGSICSGGRYSNLV